MNRFFLSVMFIVCASAWMPSSHAETPASPAELVDWYYEIGGAQPNAASAGGNTISVQFGGSAELGAGYSCGKFNPKLGVAHTLNQIADGTDDMVDAMTDAATAAIASLPALILQRANPGLYDLFQSALFRAETTVQLATKSCEEIEAQIAQGKNPFHDLVVLSKGNDWKLQMGIPDNDPVAAKKAVEDSNGDGGLPWIGGTAGGDGDEPLRLTTDVVAAGFNVIANRPLTDASSLPASSPLPLAEVWSSPNEAAEWVSQVVGDISVQTCENCVPESEPGSGLQPRLSEVKSDISSRLDTILASSTAVSLTELGEISAPGVAVSHRVVEALKELPDLERSILKERLAAEIALARTIQQALYARRLLDSGKQLPEVVGIDVASSHAEQAIATIDSEIQRLLLEQQVRGQVVSDTVLTLLLLNRQQRESSLGLPEGSPPEDRPLRGGRVE